MQVLLPMYMTRSEHYLKSYKWLSLENHDYKGAQLVTLSRFSANKKKKAISSFSLFFFRSIFIACYFQVRHSNVSNTVCLFWATLRLYKYIWFEKKSRTFEWSKNFSKWSENRAPTLVSAHSIDCSALLQNTKSLTKGVCLRFNVSISILL